MPSSTEALGSLQQFQQGMQSPEQALQASEGQLGVQAAQTQVQGLRGAIQNTTNLLNQVAPSVYGRTGGSLVTQAQATRQIGNEQAPIQDNLSKLGTDYTNANQDYTNLEDRAAKLADAKVSGQNSQLSYLQQIYQDALDQEKEAESVRQFNESQKTARASASSGLDLGGLLGSLGDNSPTPSSPVRPVQDYVDQIRQLRNSSKTPGQLGYGYFANLIESALGGEIARGSNADVALRYYFNPQESSKLKAQYGFNG